MARWLLLFSLAALTARADIDFHRTLFDWDRTCANYVEEPRDRLTFEDVKQFVGAHRVKSVWQFVAAMAVDETFRTFLKSFQLMHHSQSAQRASVDPEHPRVIFYQRGLLLAVTDHPTIPNPKVEVIQYDPAHHRFDFKQIDFSKAQPFEDHPTSCQQCHGSPALPIWHTYRTWPGAYDNAGEWFRSENPELAKLTPEERQRKLARLEGDGDLEAASPPTREEMAALQKLFSNVNRKRTGIYSFLEVPRTGDDSAALTRFLTDLNYHRITWELHQAGAGDRYRYATLGALLRCRHLEDFLGPYTRAAYDRAWQGKPSGELYTDVHDEMARQFQSLLSYATRIDDRNAMRETAFNDEDDAVRFSGLRYFFEKQGVNVKRFSLNFSPGASEGYGLSIVGAGGGGWRFGGFCRFIPEAVRADADLAPLLALEPIGSESVDEVERYFCGLLREKSRAALP